MFGGQHRIDAAETARASWGDTSETTQPKRRDSRAAGKVCAWTEKIPIKPLETVGVVRDNAAIGHVKFAPNDVFGYARGVNGAARQLLRGGVGCGWADHGFGEAVHFFGLRAELQQQQVHPGAFE